jgi:hypothetical protein
VTCYGLLGALCLALLWANALLVAVAAWKELGALRTFGARMLPLAAEASGVGLIEAKVDHGVGMDGAFATHAIRQVGSSLEVGGPRIVFRDRTHESCVKGGILRAGHGRLHVAPDAERAVVWTSARAREQASACADPSAFDAAYDAARAAQGFARTVETLLREGDDIFVWGEVTGEGDARVLRAPGGGDLLVAAEDPRVFVARKSRLIVSFVVCELLTCALCTRLATWAPSFGRVSTIGAVLCLGFFLAVTPIGVWVRDRCRPPSRAFLNGVWIRGR